MIPNYKTLRCSGTILKDNSKEIVKKWTFVPTDDITVKELSLLLPFLLTSGRPGLILSDLEYFENTNLLRHFIIEDVSNILQVTPNITIN
jgi:hypothetical protein